MFWEPVAGTGERLMAGVFVEFGNAVTAHRILRDDVLDGLYGSASAAPKALLDEAFRIALIAIKLTGLEAFDKPFMGLHPGTPRASHANSVSEAVRQAALLYSSLAHLDSLEDDDEDALPTEDVNKRFSTEVKEAVLNTRPDLAPFFGKRSRVIENGSPVKFGFINTKVAIHFSVLHPVRQSASVHSARAKLWELSKLVEFAQLGQAALITGIPRDDDPTLGARQLRELAANRDEIEREADKSDIRVFSVTSARDGALRVIELAAA
jgi:hypothetical protein